MLIRFKHPSSEVTCDSDSIVELADSIISRIIDNDVPTACVIPCESEDDSALFFLRMPSNAPETVLFAGSCHLALIGRFKKLAGLSTALCLQQGALKDPHRNKWKSHRVTITTCGTLLGGNDRFQMAIIAVSESESRLFGG